MALKGFDAYRVRTNSSFTLLMIGNIFSYLSSFFFYNMNLLILVKYLMSSINQSIFSCIALNHIYRHQSA